MELPHWNTYQCALYAVNVKSITGHFFMKQTSATSMQTIEQLRSGELAGIRHLTLRCGLSSFPREILDLADSLEILDLSGNALCALPDDLWRLRRLRVIFCSENQFTELPDVLGACPELSMVGFKANHAQALALAQHGRQIGELVVRTKQDAQLVQAWQIIGQRTQGVA
jgi:hypothetical protein